MTDFKLRAKGDHYLLKLHGGDPFDHIVKAAEKHRLKHGPKHGPVCGLYPAGPGVMRMAASLVKASRAKRILDIGAGFGHSTLWLAEAAGAGSKIDAIDQFPEHISKARFFAKKAGLSKRISFITGVASEVLQEVSRPYDFIHDDGWFAAKPPYFERVLTLLKKQGILTSPSWFLLEDAITGVPFRDWSEFAGKKWREQILQYAEDLATEPRLYVTFAFAPPLGFAVKIKN